jgi:hypothetical protein
MEANRNAGGFTPPQLNPGIYCERIGVGLNGANWYENGYLLTIE